MGIWGDIKKDWSWKSFLIGGVVGRITAGQSEPDSDQVVIYSDENNDDMVEAMTVVFAVMKELFEAIGDGEPVTFGDFGDSIDAVAQSRGGLTRQEERELISLAGRMNPIISRIASSTIPMVPVFVRPKVYECMDRGIFPKMAKLAEADRPERNSDFEAQVEEVRRVRHIWENEGRPDTYSQITRRLELVYSGNWNI